MYSVNEHLIHDKISSYQREAGVYRSNRQLRPARKGLRTQAASVLRRLADSLEADLATANRKTSIRAS